MLTPSSNGFSTMSARRTLIFFVFLFLLFADQADGLCHAASDLETRCRVKNGVKRIQDLSQRTKVAREVRTSGWDEWNVMVEEGGLTRELQRSQL